MANHLPVRQPHKELSTHRLIPIRFDPIYHGHFKCNLKSIEKDYPNILRWARQIYQMPGGTLCYVFIHSHLTSYT
jgi:glutathionyl-hydroquinone reductase